MPIYIAENEHEYLTHTKASNNVAQNKKHQV